MQITFIKDCPPIEDSGWSFYKQDAKADLRRGRQLIDNGYAREGWEPIPEPEPAKPAPRKRRTRKASK